MCVLLLTKQLILYIIEFLRQIGRAVRQTVDLIAAFRKRKSEIT